MARLTCPPTFLGPVRRAAGHVQGHELATEAAHDRDIAEDSRRAVDRLARGCRPSPRLRSVREPKRAEDARVVADQDQIAGDREAAVDGRARSLTCQTRACDREIIGGHVAALIAGEHETLGDCRPPGPERPMHGYGAVVRDLRPALGRRSGLDARPRWAAVVGRDDCRRGRVERRAGQPESGDQEQQHCRGQRDPERDADLPGRSPREAARSALRDRLDGDADVVRETLGCAGPRVPV